MRAVVQRVSRAEVRVGGAVTGRIEGGMLVLLGVEQNDSETDVAYMTRKIVGLRIFEDAEGKMNRSLTEAGGGMLVVSQFTLLGDCRKGRRPNFTRAADPQAAEALYGRFVEEVSRQGVEVQTGRFREHMDVELINDGPVTILIDSRQEF